MTVMSYLAYPTELGKEQLYTDLSKINGCDVEVSENKDILILVTTAENKIEEEEIQAELSKLKSLSCLALVYAGNEDQIVEDNLN